MTFVKDTLAALGIDDTANTFKVMVAPDGRYPDRKEEREYKIFEADEKDNLLINYIRLDGRRYDFRKPDNKWPVNFIRTRLREPIKDKDGKEVRYLSPKGSGMNPFFPPQIIAKYQANETIETLIVTEGEKKAFKGCMCGFDVVGIPSIHGFYDSDIRGKLHEDLMELIIRCRVKTIVYLTDADTRVIKYEKEKDLSKRQESFYAAIKLFRNSLNVIYEAQDTDLSRVFFAHINEKFIQDGKGLDDLLISQALDLEEIRKNFYQFEFSSRYFSFHNISDGKTGKVWTYLGLKDEQEFYSVYKSYIGSREFNFKGRRYEFDGEKVKYVKHEDTDKFMRIGSDWLKVIKRPNKFGDMIEEIIPFKVGEILRDYKKFGDFIDNIPRYDSFCSEPCWDADYRRVHYGCYNIYSPLIHSPARGQWPNIYKFLKHLFRADGHIDFEKDEEHGALGDIFLLALDYLTILLRHPKQMLPALVLVSPENTTGKSTFLKFLDAMYSGNVAILNNELFKMKFNAHYITKFIIAIDEGFLDVDKKAEKERLKQLVTADTAFLENKGMNVKSFPYYGKVILCSNDADSVMKIEETDTRWFIVRVHPITDNEDPDMERKMKSEIPAFIHYLSQRQIKHERTGRLWFKTEYIITDQFREIMENTRTSLEKSITEFLQETFITYRIEHIRADLNYLTRMINQESKYKYSKVDIKKYFEKKGYKLTLGRCIIPVGFNPDPNGYEVVSLQNYTARCYDLHAKDWVKDQEIPQTLVKTDELPF